MAHFAKRFGFDLTNAFACYVKLAADLLEGSGIAIGQSKAKREHFLFADGERFKHITDFFAQEAESGHFGGVFSGFIFDEVSEAGVVAVADRCLKGNGLLSDFQDGAHTFHRQFHFVGQLFGRCLATKLL